MGNPAARVGDMHVCPMQTPAVVPIPHVGGPILPPGVPTVLIGGMPAAVMGGMATCVGPPDAILMGSAGVMIGGQPAARVGDTCAHGGTIVMGLPTVLIGETMPGPPPVVVVTPFGGGPAQQPSPVDETENAQADTLKSAAQRGAPFCEVCEAEKNKEQEKKSSASKTFVEFELKDDEGNPIPAERYRVELPDGSVKEGLTDSEGKVHIDGVDPGTAKITFPGLGPKA